MRGGARSGYPAFVHLPDASSDALLHAACRVAWATAGRTDPLPELPGSPGASLDLVPDEDPAGWLGRVHAAVLAPRARRRAGAHYTPPRLAAEVVAHTLDPLFHGASVEELAALRIVDPACGPGAFLRAARDHLARALARAGHPSPERAALDGVLGVDLDPWAVVLARIALALDADAPPDAPRIHRGDALLGPTPGRRDLPCPIGAAPWPDLVGHGVDAVVGNPPFLGGKRLRTELGAAGRDAVRARRLLSGNADLAAHFVHLSAELLRPGGRFGLVLTDTIAQGDTRRDGLARVMADGITLVRATRSMPWPGQANVRVAIVHGVAGDADEERILDGSVVPWIGSHLRSDPLEDAPRPVADGRPRAFIGCDLKGPGFLLGDADDAPLSLLDAWREEDPEVDTVVRPYVTGRTLTDRPDGHPERRVIDFSALDEATARGRHPAAFAHVHARLPADRARRSPEVARAPWWRFWRVRQDLRDTLAPLERCLVAPVVSRHLLWSWQPTDRVFSHKVVVVGTDDPWWLGVLQSRLHEHWARALSSTFGAGLNYTPSRCFATFPVPPRSDAVSEAAEALDTTRRAACRRLELGPSAVWSRMLAGEVDVDEVRTARDALDAAVLAAWGWEDLDVADADACIRRMVSFTPR